MSSYQTIQNYIKAILTTIEDYTCELSIHGQFLSFPNLARIIARLEEHFEEMFNKKLNIVDVNNIYSLVGRVNKERGEITSFGDLESTIIAFIKLYRVFLDLDEQYSNAKPKEKFVYNKYVKPVKQESYAKYKLTQEQINNIINTPRDKEVGFLTAKFFKTLTCSRVNIPSVSVESKKLNINKVREIIRQMLRFQCKLYKDYDIYYVPFIRIQEWPTEGDVPECQYILTYYTTTYITSRKGKMCKSFISYRYSVGYTDLEEPIEQYTDFIQLDKRWGNNFEKFMPRDSGEELTV